MEVTWVLGFVFFRFIIQSHGQEWEKGQKQLAADLDGHKAGYVAARINRRLATDLYARGVVRGSVECANLTIHSQHHDATHAESMKTAKPTTIALSYPLQLLDKAFKQEPWPAEPRRQQMDKRSWVQKKITSMPFWTAYGARGCHPALHELCAYEFARHYYFGAAQHPLRLGSHRRQLQQPDKYRAKLTNQGVEKLAENSRATLVAGVDYCIRDEGGRDWLPFGQGEHAQSFRHDWAMVKHTRPQAPVVAGAQGSKSEEEQVMRILLLFVPWVNDVADASARVPFIGHLRRPHMESWRRALSYYFMTQGFPTQEVKNLVVRFCDVCCLPRHLQNDVDLAENSDNENMEDEDVVLDEEDMLAARQELGTLTPKRMIFLVVA